MTNLIDVSRLIADELFKSPSEQHPEHAELGSTALALRTDLPTGVSMELAYAAFPLLNAALHLTGYSLDIASNAAKAALVEQKKSFEPKHLVDTTTNVWTTEYALQKAPGVMLSFMEGGKRPEAMLSADSLKGRIDREITSQIAGGWKAARLPGFKDKKLVHEDFYQRDECDLGGEYRLSDLMKKALYASKQYPDHIMQIMYRGDDGKLSSGGDTDTPQPVILIRSNPDGDALMAMLDIPIPNVVRAPAFGYTGSFGKP